MNRTPFSGNDARTCPKCQALAAPASVFHNRWEDEAYPPEWLTRSCPVCGYTWEEGCADAGEPDAQ